MNKVEAAIKREINKSALKNGIPILHANIRFMECVLKVSYRLSFKKWQVSFLLIYLITFQEETKNIIL